MIWILQQGDHTKHWPGYYYRVNFKKILSVKTSFDSSKKNSFQNLEILDKTGYYVTMIGVG